MRTWVRAVATTATVALLAAGPAWAQQPDLPPEIATGTMTKPLVTARKEMVVSANPLASQAGYEILKRGGNAVDAAIAVQLVLGLVEPQSSGLGGGAFLVYYDAGAKRLTTFDARETAPFAAT